MRKVRDCYGFVKISLISGKASVCYGFVKVSLNPGKASSRRLTRQSAPSAHPLIIARAGPFCGPMGAGMGAASQLRPRLC